MQVVLLAEGVLVEFLLGGLELILGDDQVGLGLVDGGLADPRQVLAVAVILGVLERFGGIRQDLLSLSGQDGSIFL